MDLADFYEESIDHLSIRRDHWIFDHGDITPEVEKVFRWLIEQDKKDLHAPRNKDGKSFYQRREEKRTENTTIKEGEIMEH
jgi:hypothetical protein